MLILTTIKCVSKQVERLIELMERGIGREETYKLEYHTSVFATLLKTASIQTKTSLLISVKGKNCKSPLQVKL